MRELCAAACRVAWVVVAGSAGLVLFLAGCVLAVPGLVAVALAGVLMKSAVAAL